MPRRLGAALLGLVGFLVLAALVVAHPAPLPLDRELHRLALQHREPILGVAKFCTQLGTGPVIVPLVLLASAVFARRNRRLLLIAVGPLLLAAGQVVRLVAVSVIDRPRPPVADWVTSPAGQSFSGHTTTAGLGYGLILLLLAGSVRASGARVLLAGLLLSVATVVGISRVLLGVHWPTDVLGGWSLALCESALSAVALRRLDRSRGMEG